MHAKPPDIVAALELEGVEDIDLAAPVLTETTLEIAVDFPGA